MTDQSVTDQSFERRTQNDEGRTEKPYDIDERAFLFACDIARLHSELSRHGSTRRPMVNQLLRSGTAIGANLQEARAGQSNPDFIAKCRIALKEARETHYWLRLLQTCELGPPEVLHALTSEADEIVAILTTIVKNASMKK